ncbi:unnamed protein product, partial [Allacma fusca]
FQVNVDETAGPSRRFIANAPRSAPRTLQSVPLPPPRPRPAEALGRAPDQVSREPQLQLEGIEVIVVQPVRNVYVGHLPQREVAVLPGRSVVEAPVLKPGEVADLTIRAPGARKFTGQPKKLR